MIADFVRAVRGGRSALVLACAALAAPGVASAAIVTNGSFEQPALGFHTVLPGQTYGSWTCDGPDDIEFVRAEVNGSLPGLEFSAYDGEYWIDLGGVGRASGIHQDLVGLTPGGLYRVDFAFACNVWGPDFNFIMDVDWNGVTVGTFSRIGGGFNGAFMNWENKFVDVLATGSDRLAFRGVTAISARGPAIDAVSMSPIPAPGAAAFLAGGLALVARRRR